MTRHLGLNGRNIHTISSFTALEELNSCHRRPSPLQGPCLVRLPTSFITAYPLYSQSSTSGTSTSGDTIVCGVVLSPYSLFTMFVTFPSSSGSLSPTHVLAVTTETFYFWILPKPLVVWLGMTMISC